MNQMKCMEVFVKVVQSGSFAAVADSFGMSGPMIGRHVRTLEDTLGVQLLNRTTRRHSLTEAGQIYYQSSLSILADIDAANASVAQLRSAPRGVLRVGSPVAFGSSCLAPALPEYLAANPEVRVDMTLNNRVLDVMEEGYDVVIRMGNLPDSGLIARALSPYRLVACASKAYLAKHGTPKHPRDLASHACLGFRPGETNDSWTFVNPHRKADVISVSVSGPLSINDGQALREAALRDVGIILQSEALLKEDLEANRLVRVLKEYTPQALPTHVLYTPTRTITPKLRSFLDFLTSRFGTRPS